MTNEEKFAAVAAIAPENVWMDGELTYAEAVENGARMYDRAHADGATVKYCGCERCSQ